MKFSSKLSLHAAAMEVSLRVGIQPESGGCIKISLQEGRNCIICMLSTFSYQRSLYSLQDLGDGPSDTCCGFCQISGRLLGMSFNNLSKNVICISLQSLQNCLMTLLIATIPGCNDRYGNMSLKVGSTINVYPKSKPL